VRDLRGDVDEVGMMEAREGNPYNAGVVDTHT
jgi:hypothetical protein